MKTSTGPAAAEHQGQTKLKPSGHGQAPLSADTAPSAPHRDAAAPSSATQHPHRAARTVPTGPSILWAGSTWRPFPQGRAGQFGTGDIAGRGAGHGSQGGLGEQRH